MRVLEWTGQMQDYRRTYCSRLRVVLVLGINSVVKSPASWSDFEWMFLPPQVFHLNPETILSSKGIWESAGFRIFKLQCFWITVLCVEEKWAIWAASRVQLFTHHMATLCLLLLCKVVVMAMPCYHSRFIQRTPHDHHWAHIQAPRY